MLLLCWLAYLLHRSQLYYMNQNINMLLFFSFVFKAPVATSPFEAPPKPSPTHTSLTASSKGKHSNLSLIIGIGAGILLISIIAVLILCLCTFRQEKTKESNIETGMWFHFQIHTFSCFLLVSMVSMIFGYYPGHNLLLLGTIVWTNL